MATFSLGDAVISLTTKAESFNKGLGDAEKTARQRFGNIENLAKSMGKAMSVAGIAITTGVISAAKSFANYGDEINKASQRTGMTTEAISSLRYAAEQSGASLETVEKATKAMSKSLVGARDASDKSAESLKSKLQAQIQKTSKNINDLSQKYNEATQRLKEMELGGQASESQLMAQRNKIDDLSTAYSENVASLESLRSEMNENAQSSNKAALAYSKLGLSASELINMSPEKAFIKIGDAISKIPNETERTQLSLLLFGKSGAELAPLFAEGAAGVEQLMSRAKDLGLVIDQEAANQATELGDLWDDVGKVLRSVGIEIGKQFSPMLKQLAIDAIPVIGKAREWVSANKDVVITIGKIGLALAVGGPFFIGITMATTAISNLIFIIQALMAVGFGTWISGIIGAGAFGLVGFAAAVLAVVAALGIGAGLYGIIQTLTNDSGYDNWLTRIIDKHKKWAEEIDAVFDKLVALYNWVTNNPFYNPATGETYYGPSGPRLNRNNPTVRAVGQRGAESIVDQYLGSGYPDLANRIYQNSSNQSINVNVTTNADPMTIARAIKRELRMARG